MNFYIKTHGCQMNVYDSEKIADILQVNCNMQSVNKPEDASILILNTCSIREKAQEKVFSELGRWNAIKKDKPEVIICVGGCVASQEGPAIARRAPYVDIVFGPQTLHRLPNILQELRENQDKRKTIVDTSFPEIEKFDNLPSPLSRGPTAFVSIMEGCNKYCSFCVVPYTRGEEISRPQHQIIEEISHLALNGVKEITLLGQNVNAYRTAEVDFAQLLYMVAAIEGIERIRFTSSHPLEFNDAQIEAYRDLPHLANQLHLPLQSGCDRILMQMKRGHTVLEYKEKIYKLRKVRPDISLSSDFIVGFPGETDAEHRLTLDIVARLGFDKSFSFVYSQRPGTPAAYLHDNTTKQQKVIRLAELQEILNSNADKLSKAMLGTKQKILVDDYSKKDPGMLQGRTENNRLVNFACEDATLIGKFVSVEIIESLPNSLRGKICDDKLNNVEQTIKDNKEIKKPIHTQEIKNSLSLPQDATRSSLRIYGTTASPI